MSEAITTYEALAALNGVGVRLWGCVEYLDGGNPMPFVCGVVGQVAHGYLEIRADDSDRDLTIYRDANRRLWFFHEEAPARAKHDAICRAWLERRRQEDIKALREESGWEGTP